MDRPKVHRPAQFALAPSPLALAQLRAQSSPTRVKQPQRSPLLALCKHSQCASCERSRNDHLRHYARSVAESNEWQDHIWRYDSTHIPGETDEVRRHLSAAIRTVTSCSAPSIIGNVRQSNDRRCCAFPLARRSRLDGSVGRAASSRAMASAVVTFPAPARRSPTSEAV